MGSAAYVIGTGLRRDSGWSAGAIGVLVLLFHHVRHMQLLADWLREPDADKLPLVGPERGIIVFADLSL